MEPGTIMIICPRHSDTAHRDALKGSCWIEKVKNPASKKVDMLNVLELNVH